MSYNPSVCIIGSGFAGLSAACFLAKEGFQVNVFEKNASLGGRARLLQGEGFSFDMGPSWYWMPDVFDDFFAKFGKKTSDYYELKRLSPSYRVVFGENNFVDMPASVEGLMELFESKEKGAGEQLRKFLDEGHFKYDIGIKKLVYKPSQSVLEFLDWQLIKGVFQLHVFQSIGNYIRKYFKHPELIKLLEFPVLFLGGTPENTPALYSLMNYSDMVLGTWYPVGGMYEVVKAMVALAESLGVKIHTNSPVSKIEVENQKAVGVWVNGKLHTSDFVVGGADYHHVEKFLLAKEYQTYSDKYWDERVLAPSALLYYVGVKKELSNVLHHILFFDEDFSLHAKEIYDNPQFPTKPLFYVSCASKTDKTVAPAGCDALVLLIPVAPGLKDTEEIREKYYNLIMERMEKLTGQEIRSQVVFKQSYAQSDFIQDYNSLKGNAYGLANTLMQTAIFKPALQSKKVKNLFFAGQLTVPGPGVPPAIISGEVVSKVITSQIER